MRMVTFGHFGAADYSGYAILCDGVQFAGGSGVMLYLVNGVIWSENTASSWYSVVGTGWHVANQERQQRACNLAGAVTTLAGPLQINTTTSTTISSFVKSPSERRPRCRQDRHAHAHHERSGDGQHDRRHADADAERRRHRDLYQRLGHQCADLQLYGGGRQNTAALDGDGRQPQRCDYQGRRRQCRRPVADRLDPEPARRSTPRRRRYRR